MTIRLAIRGYLGRTVKWEKSLALDERKLDKVVPDLAKEHADAMAAKTLDMVEIEFLDEPDVNQRYLRLGTNSAGMVAPMRLKL